MARQKKTVTQHKPRTEPISLHLSLPPRMVESIQIRVERAGTEDAWPKPTFGDVVRNLITAGLKEDRFKPHEVTPLSACLDMGEMLLDRQIEARERVLLVSAAYPQELEQLRELRRKVRDAAAEAELASPSGD